MAINESLRALIRELLDDELKEISASGAAGPYMTPKAFGKKKPASGVSKQEKPVKFGGTSALED